MCFTILVKTNLIILFLLFLLPSLFELVFPKPIFAGDCNLVDSTHTPCPAGGAGGSCNVSGSSVTIIDSCNAGDISQWHWDYNCSDGPSAQAMCGGAAQTCTNGTCDSSSCGWNGNGNCNDFGWHDGCDAAPAGCYWDSLGQSGWNEGVCKGRYCIVDNSPGNGCFSFNNNKGLCQGSGCNWTQGPDNTCADACSLNGAACGQMQCHDSCTGGVVNGTCPAVTCQHYACSGTACTAVAGQGANTCTTGTITWPATVTPYPATGATNVSVNPILTWTPIDGTNGSSWGDSCATTHTYNLYLKKQGAARPFLDPAMKSSEEVMKLLQDWEKGLKIAMFGIGKKSILSPTEKPS